MNDGINPLCIYNTDQLNFLAEGTRDSGNIDKYLDVLFEFHRREPLKVEYIVDIIDTFFDTDRMEDAEKFISNLDAQLLGDSRILQKIKQIENRKNKISTELAYSKDDINLFISIFQGREGVYAKQTIDSQGKWGYFPVHTYIDSSVVKSHFDGDLTVGLYFVRVDNTTLVSCIDFDLNKRVIDYDSDKLANTKKLLDSYVQNAAQICCSNGIPFLLENSGGKGYHLWICYTGGVSAKLARNLLKTIMEKSGSPPEGTNYEIFPKQDKVESGGLGNLVKLPLGIHKKTGNRGLFVSIETLIPLEDQFEVMNKLEKLDSSRIDEIIRLAGGVSIPLEFSPESYTEDFRKVYDNCPVISHLINKVVVERHLTHSERVVLLYSVSFLPECGEKVLHDIMAWCSDYSREITSKYFLSRRNNNMSCPKIRSWLPDISKNVKCSCYFEDIPGKYPSPLRFLSFQPAISHNELINMVREYFAVGRNIKMLLEKRKLLEEKLCRFFDEYGADSISTSTGEISRLVDNQGRTRFQMLLKDTDS